MKPFRQEPAPFAEEADNESLRRVFDEILDCLSEAGYYRVRISSLEPFDKVIGGLSYCITATGLHADIFISDEVIIYRENATIAYKIALSEKIVHALLLMKCPHSLEPHQIQGLDYENILPVVKWIVSKVIELREEYGAILERVGKYLFDKDRHKLGKKEQFVLDLLRKYAPDELEYIMNGVNKNNEGRSQFEMENRRNMLQQELLTLKSDIERVKAETKEYRDKLALLEEEHSNLAPSPVSEQTFELIKKDLSLKVELERRNETYQMECKATLKQMKQKIQTLKEESAQDSEENSQDFVYKESKSLSDLKNSLDEVNHKISTLKRNTNDITPYELSQYEFRFSSLYKRVAEQLSVLKDRYTTYNHLGTIRNQLTKERDLYKSIDDSLSLISSSKSNEKKFMESLNSWLEASEGTLRKMNQKVLDEEIKKRDDSLAKFEKLKALKKMYKRALKEFEKKLKV